MRRTQLGSPGMGLQSTISKIVGDNPSFLGHLHTEILHVLCMFHLNNYMMIRIIIGPYKQNPEYPQSFNEAIFLS